MSSSLVRMKHDKQKVKVPAIPTPPTFHLLCYLGQWILVLLILPCSASAACDRLDRDALLSLPFNTPLNWSASTDCCLWDGVTYDPVEHSRVVRLSLPKRGLSGVVLRPATTTTVISITAKSTRSPKHYYFKWFFFVPEAFVKSAARPGRKKVLHQPRTTRRAARESRPQSAYGNGRPASLQGRPKSQDIYSETTKWNGYQASAHLPHRNHACNSTSAICYEQAQENDAESDRGAVVGGMACMMSV
ncbi:hypothetical protein FF1_034743 [Malus domestica]